MGAQASQTYSLKESTRKTNANAFRYTEAQLGWVSDNMKEVLHFFGYARLPEDPSNITGFFEYDGSDAEMNRQYKGWKAQNEAMVNWVCHLTDDDLENFKYRLSDPAKEVPLMDFDTSVKATTAISDFYSKKLYNKPFAKIN